MLNRMGDSGPRRDYDENSAELQWLEDSANDIVASTFQAVVGLCWAFGALVWYSGVAVLVLVNVLTGALKKR